MYHLSALDRINWPRMDEIFTQDLWRNSLRRVTIEIGFSLLTEAVIGKIRGCLPKLSAISSVVFTVRSRQLSWKGID
jgi:hypothetical protein